MEDNDPLLGLLDQRLREIHQELAMIENRAANIDDDLPTPRERIATHVLSALILKTDNPPSSEALVIQAVEYADALLEELDNTRDLAPQSGGTTEPGK